MEATCSALTRVWMPALLLVLAGPAFANHTTLRQHGVSAPLRQFAALSLPPAASSSDGGIRPFLALQAGERAALDIPPPSRAQRPLPFVRTGGASINVDGLAAGDAGVAGAAGHTQFVHAAGSAMSVHRKEDGALVEGPFDLRAVFVAARPGADMDACRAQHDGATEVRFDHLARRWLLAYKASPHVQCIAISSSSDAAGRYYRYAIRVGGNGGKPLDFDDVRMAVWPGAYHFSFVLFDGARYLGPRICTLARDAMLAGRDAALRCRDLGKAAGPVSPAFFEGTASTPAAASGGAFIGLAIGDAGVGTALQLWRMPAKAAAPLVPLTVEVAPFLPGAAGLVLPPPGAAIAPLGDRIAAGAVYRMLDGREVLLAAHSVLLHDGRTGLRWYDIGDPLGAAFIARHGTHDAGGEHRFMPSIGMDKRGNIALGYQAAAADTPPGIRYTGREPGDPPGMLQTEEVIVSGSGVPSGQSHGARASGSLALDPADGCTFWYTQRYVPLTGAAPWRARIARFRFRSCE